MNRFMPWLRHHDAINIGGEMGFHTVWTHSGPTTQQVSKREADALSIEQRRAARPSFNISETRQVLISVAGSIRFGDPRTKAKVNQKLCRSPAS
jgi:hypothetical protein